MKSLSEFLEVPEGVEFRIYKGSDVYKIENNTIKFKDDSSKEWTDSGLSINNVKKFEITILQKQILTDEERECMKAIIKYCSKEVNSIYRPSEDVFDFNKVNSEGNVETIISIKISGKYLFKNLEIQKPYTLEDLGLEN